MIFPERDEIAHNRAAHDREAETYDERHVEIYNPVEQSRLHDVVRRAFAEIRTERTSRRTLDFGAGTGNLTRHFLDHSDNVVAADISRKSLERLQEKIRSPNLETVELNGADLSSLPSAEFDLVGTYSVLHHVPDYLRAVDEMVRVLAPGGVLYIDHEVCPAYWSPSPAYVEYRKALRSRVPVTARLTRRLRKATSASAWNAFLRTRLLGQRVYGDEGDIHVYPDDHIEWHRIVELIEARGCEVLSTTDYLACRERSNPVLWEAWKGQCVDMRMLLARKRKHAGSEGAQPR